MLNSEEEIFGQLGLPPQHKINLLLTIRKNKPVSILSMKNCPEVNISELEKFFVKNNLFFTKRKRSKFEEHKKVAWIEYVVTNDKKILDLLLNNKELTKKDNLEIGLALGYSKKDIEEFYRGEKTQEIEDLYKKHKREGWENYVQYINSEGYDKKEVKETKKWAKSALKEVPVVSKKYKNAIEKAVSK